MSNKSIFNKFLFNSFISLSKYIYIYKYVEFFFKKYIRMYIYI